jgi:hypothetical protein
MTENLQATTKEEFAKLPRELQEAIDTVDWVNISEEIGKKYLLSEDELNNFQVETLLVLAGLEEGFLYSDNVAYNVGLSKEKTEQIVTEVNQKIFMPIYTTLTEKIKGSTKVKTGNAEQNLNFILSGGDYLSFLG